jgi:signal recognition particle GTPase
MSTSKSLWVLANWHKCSADWHKTPTCSASAAAIDQLVTLGSKIDVPVFELGNKVAPPEIAR